MRNRDIQILVDHIDGRKAADGLIFGAANIMPFIRNAVLELSK